MKAALVGAGQTRFGDHPSLGVQELFTDAVRNLAKSMGDRWDPDRIEAAYIGSLSCGQGFQLGNFAPALMDYAGLPAVPAVHVENACASGGFALLQAVTAVASGAHDVALAAGVEKMRDVSGERGRYWLGVSGDTEYERLAGLTFAGVFGMMASHLIHEGACEREDLARVAVKNHRHAVLNPKAHLRKELSVEAVLNAPPVAHPLTAFDCCPTSDGAAAVLVVSAELAAEFTDEAVAVSGFGAAADTLALHSRRDLGRLTAARTAAERAYAMADVGPEDLDLVELHDCFTIAEVIAFEELGLSPISKLGGRLDAGEFSLGGRLPVNVSGGLKAKGHPIGATGVGQAAEIFEQLRGEARSAERQVDNARRGLAFNMGGSGASATVFILERGAR